MKICVEEQSDNTLLPIVHADNFRWTNLETALGAISRIKTFSEATEVEHLPRERTPPPEQWPRNGQIEYHGVSASYK